MVISIEDRVPAAVGLIGNTGVALTVGHILSHKALTVVVDSQQRFLAHDAGGLGVDHLGVGDGLKLCADQHTHKLAVAGLGELLFLKQGRIRAIARNHSGIVLVVAGGENNTLVGVEADVGTVLGTAYDAAYLAAVGNKLNGGSFIVEVDAELLSIFRQCSGGLKHASGEERAAQVAVTVLVLMVKGLLLHHVLEADLIKVIEIPVHRLAGALYIHAIEGQIRAVVVCRVQLVQESRHAGGRALFRDDCRTAHALGDGGTALLQHADGNALLKGFDCGRKARCSGTDHDYIIGLFVVEGSDRIFLNCRLCQQCVDGIAGHGCFFLFLSLKSEGLPDAVCSSFLDAVGGHRCASDTINVGRLFFQKLCAKCFTVDAADFRGLGRYIHLYIRDFGFIKGHGDNNLFLARRFSAVGTGNIELFALVGVGGQRGRKRAQHGSGSRTLDSQLQELFTIHFFH